MVKRPGHGQILSPFEIAFVPLSKHSSNLNIFFGRARITELQTDKTRNKGCGKNFILRVQCTMVRGVSRNIGCVKHCELLGLRLDLGYSECNEFLIKQSIQEFNKRLLFVGI